MQYKVGLATVTNGDPTVTGVGTSWMSSVTSDWIFKIKDEDVLYSISSVDSDTQITLAVNYTGTSGSGKSYILNNGWTSNFQWYEIQDGDQDWPFLLTEKFIKSLDQTLGHALSGLSKTVSGSSNVTLTSSEYDYGVLDFVDGGLTGNINVIVPLIPYRVWTIINRSVTYNITIKGSTGTGILVGGDRAAIVYTDGTNVVRATLDCDPSS